MSFAGGVLSSNEVSGYADVSESGLATSAKPYALWFSNSNILPRNPVTSSTQCLSMTHW